MTHTLEELVQFVRRTIPQAKAIKHLTANDEAQVITFEWQSRKFAVRTSLQTLEMKGQKLFITGASGLLQNLFMSKAKNNTVIAEVNEVLQQVEGQMHENQKTGLELLQTVKGTLAKLAGKSLTKRKPANSQIHSGAVSSAPSLS